MPGFWGGAGRGSWPPTPSVTRWGFSAQIVILLLSYILSTNGSGLNGYISYYEPVYYNRSAVAEQVSSLQRRRVRRRADQSSEDHNSPDYRIQFKAHQRLFRLRLSGSDHQIFSPDVVFENTRGPIHYQTHRVVQGDLEDDSESHVEGILQSNGVFDGNIQTRDGVFYIEPATRYFGDSVDFPVVIYSESDVTHPVAGGHQPHRSVIFDTLPVHTKKRTSSQSIHSVPYSSNFRRSGATSDRFQNGGGGVVPPTYPDLSNQLYESFPNSDIFSDGDTAQRNAFKTKSRRAADFSKRGRRHNQLSKNKKTTCMLYLQADHLFYENMGRSEEACIEVMTRHVQRVNSIYRTVDFDMDGKPDNISFMIKRVKVHTDEALTDPGYRFPLNYGVEKFLEIFSEEDYDAFCLAYMFTYRDFEGGTLGLAWTGDLKNAGGVCEKNGHYRGSFKSLNTGVITLLNYGKHVPPAVSHVTMAHEMGHNFGSPHDPETEEKCVPGGEQGNYIMFARATSGDKVNNKKFSPCSLNSINKVLEAKARGQKGCFKEPQMAICGNGVVEEGEECDCGWEEDCLEECCHPQRTKYSINQIPCTLRAGKQCSPSQGPCCSRDCSHNLGNKCREDNGCRDESYCNGSGTSCPPSQLKPNKTVCNEEFVCFLGECTGSICLAYGMESCQCTQGPNDPDTRSCELCCKVPGESGACLSSFQLNTAPLDIPDMFSKPGTPCNKYQGYCDVFQKCREVDPSGPLATLRKILLSDKSIESLRKFLMKYWYSAVIAAIAVIALMVTIVRFCGKKTPLVHRRRRKRRSVLHTQDSEGGPVGNNVTTHPATVKHHLPFLGSKYNIYRERAGRRLERAGKKANRKPSAAAGESSRESAGNLARGLTKLIVALPPASSEESTRERPKTTKRSQSVEETGADKRAATADKTKKTKAVLEPMKKLSKSATTLTKSLDRPGEEKERAAAGKLRDKLPRAGREKAARESEPREVTIAKLGPFKMSLELRDQGNPNKVQQQPNNNNQDKSSSAKSRRRKSAVAGKEIVRQKSEVLKASPAPADKPKVPKIKREKSRDQDGDKIIVSKLVKSDRPRRDKSPEKRRADSTQVSSDDYRLTLNKNKRGTADNEKENAKFRRSVSQPNPPPDFKINELNPADLQAGADPRTGVDPRRERKTQRAISVTDRLSSDRVSAVNRKQLRRSSTTRELPEQQPRSPVERSSTLRPGVHVFDNLGFDKSPDMRRQRKPSSNSQLSELREQLETQLRKEKVKPSSISSYSLMEAASLSGSDSDSDEKRTSPPTQTQSLSEESSSASGSRRTTRDSFFKELHSSSSDEEAGEEELPQFAANPYVRVPLPILDLQSSHKGCDAKNLEAEGAKGAEGAVDAPVPLPRTSMTDKDDLDNISILTDGMDTHFTNV